MRMSSLPGDEPAARFRFGEFTFDCESHLLLRDGEEQHLSPKAQQLLRILLVHRPKAVSREEIYDTLWPSTFVCDTNMATVVSELRRALGDDARSAQYIRTVHGFGYAFAADADANDARSKVLGMLLCEEQRHLLYRGENVIGRSQDCDVILSGPTVSRHHAVITIDGDTISIEDRDSRNGTYVNGDKITRAQTRQRDKLTFGAVPAVISRKVSSTMPLPLNFREPRRQSSGSIAPA
jgi:DNA-binding winged helix-turn-helix (wHTH) protein